MARTGSSSKFVPVNLNNSYGQTLPLSNGASSSLGRSRSFTGSYGGMVSLSRSSRVSSSSPSSASVSASSRASKLAVPRPMNLPSLRREHSGNDPTIALVGSSGSSGWSKQTGDEASDLSASRSDSHSTTWGNRQPAPEAASTQITDRKSPQVARQSVHSPPGPGDAGMQSAPFVKAVVFRGEDFPTLQAAAVPLSPSLSLPPRSRDLLSKQQRDKQSEDPNELKQGSTTRDEPRPSNQYYDPHPSNQYFDQQFQPAQPVRMQVRGTFPEQNDVNADKGGTHLRGPLPLVKLTHTSNWADDERETLSSLHPQESIQSDFVEPNDSFRSTRHWQMDHNGDIDFRRPISRTGYPVRNDADSSVRMESPSLRTPYGKDGDRSRGPLSGGARFEFDSRGGFDRMSNSGRRDDFLKRGWSFSAAESNLSRDGRYANSSSGNERENYANGKTFFREGNYVKHDTAGGDMLLRDVRPGMYLQDAGQRQESKFGKDILLGRQGFPGIVSPGPRSGWGPGFPYNGSDVPLPSKQQPDMDYRRDKRASGFYGHTHDDDPFLGDGISTKPTSLYALQPRIRKNTSNDHDYRDPARESFEAELERVEKMLEQERQRAVEERERAIELARKEQEEQERLAREEEEMRIRLEQEAREAAYREQIEAEDAARRVEEARKAREEEKRGAELEEERRREAARKKLLELEERMAKRESERKREDALQTERGSLLKDVSADTSLEHLDTGRRSADTSRESHWKSSKLDENDSERLSSMVPPATHSSALPSILRSPRLSAYSKEERSSSTEGARGLQAWKREAIESGHDFHSVQKDNLRSQNDHSQQEHEDRHWGSSFRNASVRKSTASADTHSRANGDPDAADERNWWVRESPSKSQHTVEADPPGADAPDYPLYGRLRQSLPKQPRVLPPPPLPTSFRKPIVQRDDTHSGASSLDAGHIEMASKEELSLTSSESTVPHEVDVKESLVTNIQLSEQFDSVPSEEVVLSDAGSQFSDDTVEEVVTEAYQEQELHSDAVSETYTEGEVDEISDITEAQESSEDLESQKPTVWEALTGEERADDNVETPGQAGEENLEGFQEQHDTGREGCVVLSKNEEEEKIVLECTDSGRNIASSSLLEDVASARAHVDNVCGTQEAQKSIVTQSVVASGLEDAQEPVKNTEELASENMKQDHEIQPFSYQASFLPVGSGDDTQMRHLENVSPRQSLVQQFQQPFSFMAVPLPQSSTLNHVGASLPMLTPMHGLPNQQDLPFHLQLGLLPGMPLMPNAIQIGSIQMPLHIHPQIPQLAHVHGQQAPLFQFGQIGPSLPISQPIPMTHMLQPAVQMHHAIGQVNLTQQHLQGDFAGAVDTKIDSVDLNPKFGDVATEGTPLLSGAHNQGLKEDVEVKQGAPTNSEGSRIAAQKEVQRYGEEVETHSSTIAVSKLDGQKVSTADAFESSWDGDGDPAVVKVKPDSKPPRVGRRRAGVPRYQGILGRGRGRFHGGQNHFYQAPHLTSENWPEGGATKRFTRGKMIRRNYRRAEYRVREPISNFDRDTAGAEIAAAPSSNMEESKEAGGYRYVKKGPGSQANHVGEESGQSRSCVTQTPAKGEQSVNKIAPVPTSKTNSLLKKYEVDNAEDAPFRTGVVCVFEQPGIETPNDKDDFIKVRSKRQLLRESREQREKESKIKGTDLGSRDQVSKKQQRKTGINNGMEGANPARNVVKKRPMRSAESTGTNGKVSTSSLINGTMGISSAAVVKRNLTSPPKPGRTISTSKIVATTGMESFVNFAHDIHPSEQSTIAAWGGQRTNQEVVSLTQIQLEEAMKPYRLDAPFSESARISEKALVPLEPVLGSSPSLALEKPVITSGPLSSLLAGEKIQFGAVTSPTPNRSNSRSSTPIAAVRTGSPLGFGTDSSHIPGHTSSFVTSFLEQPLDASFSTKGDSANKEDGFEGKVADLELEAEAEAAASAIVAAAISSEDPIESHTNTRVSEMNAGCTTLTSVNPLNVQSKSNLTSDNPMAVALPADLSVETPPSLFHGSSMGLSNLSGVMLQSLPNGAPPAFPCLEMGPLLGGPVFNFGPREEASLASMEPGLSGWQQRHVGTPDSYYGAPPFLSPAGISSIHGHPHMLVYANPYSPVGQFGQLGVSFMGAAYHPSGKQPDWTHVPLSSGSSGALALNNGDLSAGSNGPIVPQHLSGQRTGVAGSSLMSVAPPPNLFDAGVAAPFQVPQMDGFMQSHWSKAPAPPVHSVPISGSSLPSQMFPLSRPAVDLNMQIHSSRVFPNQSGHLVDASSVFHKPPVLNAASGSSFPSTTADSGAQFPDELGLGDSIPTLQSDAGRGGALSEAATSVESTGIKMQRGRRPPAHNSQGNSNSLNNNNSTAGEVISAANSQEQSRNGHVGRISSPSLRASSLQFAEQRAASKQGVPKESVGSEWPRGSQRKGVAGRVPSSDRGGGSVLPSKLKQIYVAKPAADARKLSAAACS